MKLTYAQLALADSAATKLTGWITGLKTKSIKALDKKYDKMEAKLTKQTASYLKKLQKKEKRIQQKLQATDSIKAKELAGSSDQLYTQLNNKLQNSGNKIRTLNSYIPGLDSLNVASKYLSQTTAALKNLSPDKLEALRSLNGRFASLQGQMQTATDIKAALRKRKDQLKQQLSNAFDQEIQGFNKQVYYYQAQVDEYKSMLSDPDKLSKQLIAWARQLPAFQDFMNRNSQLALLFPVPANIGTSQALAGLQTSNSVVQQLQQQMGTASGSANPQSYMQQQMSAAQTQLNQLKDKVNQAGGGSSDMTIPDFKPNTQKTKSFLKRLEFGFNIQSQKTNYFLPTTSDIALTVGYKLSDKATTGIGASYKLGWGKGLNEISMSNQGMSIRTYADIKLKGSIWITGGYEQNWLPQLATILDSANVHPSGWGNGWQKSGLVGLTKKYKIGKKTGNFQLLWDFLSYQQIPKTQALKFRIGYTF